MEREQRRSTPAAAIADPDSRARTHLANERTFLAWLRTGLNLLVLGLAVAQFADPTTVLGLPLVPLFALGMVLSGVLLTVMAGQSYRRGRAQIDRGAFQPADRVVVAAVGLLVIVGVVAFGVVVALANVVP